MSAFPSLHFEHHPRSRREFDVRKHLIRNPVEPVEFKPKSKSQMGEIGVGQFALMFEELLKFSLIGIFFDMSVARASSPCW